MFDVDLFADEREKRRAARTAAANFIRAAVTNDIKLLAESLNILAPFGNSRRNGLKRMLRQEFTVHPALRPVFLEMYEERGDQLRSAFDDDLVLLDLLHRFLPPYSGPSVELYRGETAWNRRRRTYGMRGRPIERQRPALPCNPFAATASAAVSCCELRHHRPRSSARRICSALGVRPKRNTSSTVVD
jgi:hypothetical protein